MSLRSTPLRLLAAAAAFGLLAAACGDDDDDDAAATTTTTEAPAEESTTTTTAGTPDDDLTELCAVAQEMDDSDSFPTADQIQRYEAAAPDELQDAVSVAGPAIVDNDGDVVTTLAALAEDDVTAAVDELNAFESDNCGIDHSDDSFSGDEDAAAGSTEVDVTASEYSFDIPEGITAGPTAFKLTNPGAEAHFMEVVQIAEGHTLDEALQFEGDPEEAGLVTSVGGSGLAAPGGEDTEFPTPTSWPATTACSASSPAPTARPTPSWAWRSSSPSADGLVGDRSRSPTGSMVRVEPRAREAEPWAADSHAGVRSSSRPPAGPLVTVGGRQAGRSGQLAATGAGLCTLSCQCARSCQLTVTERAIRGRSCSRRAGRRTAGPDRRPGHTTPSSCPLGPRRRGEGGSIGRAGAPAEASTHTPAAGFPLPA